ncbi:hypothetical protein HPB47_016470, partial [Ixodes persulcatus]
GSKQPGLNKAERSYQACLRSRQRDVSSLVDFLRNRGLSWPDRRPARIHPVDVLVDLDVNWNLGLWFTVRLVRRSSKDKRLIRIGEGIVSGAWRKFIRQLAARGHYKDYVFLEIKGGAYVLSRREIEEMQVYDLSNVANLTLAEGHHGELSFQMKQIQQLATPSHPPAMWVKLLNKHFGKTYRFTETDQILVTNVKLLQALDRLCQLSSPEDILRYISWTVVQLLGWMADPTLPGRPQSAAAEDSRSVDCFWAVDRVFGLASWSSYITSRFPPAVRADVDRILSSVVQSTVDMLLRSSWIDNATKEVAVHKVRNIQTFLWPPEEFFNATETADLLKPFPDPSDSVISSWLRASIVRRGLLGRAGFESLLDADSDLRSLFRYRYYVNELAVSLTAVSSPLYIQGATSALNYGGLGVHYATTLARAFDHKGVLVDALGRGRLWWSRASYPAYESKSSCRGGDGAESTNTDMDGVTALGIAYDAFNVNRALSSRKISDAKFLGMSEDQVFFVGFCQAFCASIPTEQQRSSCDTPLKNSGEFARAFNCPLNSPMNPSVKCSFFDDAGERSRPSASVATIRTPHLGDIWVGMLDGADFGGTAVIDLLAKLFQACLARENNGSTIPRCDGLQAELQRHLDDRGEDIVPHWTSLLQSDELRIQLLLIDRTEQVVRDLQDELRKRRAQL